MHHPCAHPIVVDARGPEADAVAALRSCDAVALAVPEEPARAWAEALAAVDVRVLDLSGAHRRVDGVHYGIPELFGAPPQQAKLVANPGCYPTATLLALAPLVRAKLVDNAGIPVVGCSGTSGAGKALRDDLHFSELHGNLFPYAVGTHRHAPEIEHHLGASVAFVTQLVPVVRGLMITAFVRSEHAPALLRDALRASYESHPWITVLAEPGLGLGLRHAVGTHQAIVAVGPSAKGGVVPIFCTIDNLMRGAASQALHNLNLWLGLPPDAGLPAPMRSIPDGVPGMTRMLP
jgi:N-acetyl-gamma-glutamyl-phosphate reductase